MQFGGATKIHRKSGVSGIPELGTAGLLSLAA
jgi:hypothetical protein